MEDIRVRYLVDTSDLKKAERALEALTQEEKEIVEGFKKINSESSRAAGGVSSDFSRLNSTIKGIGSVLAGAFVVDKLMEYGKKVIDITAQFQKFEAVLTNSLGSNSAAQMALQQIQDFAAKTPFSVAELTESFVKLANQGFVPTTNQLRQLGDLASSTGKSFDQLAEAIIDAQTGEFERLKEFGIRASKEGDNVKFTFKGVETQVKFTSDSIKDYITSLGDLQGVSGSMAAISNTLGGQISNLGDSFDQLFKAIGDGTGGIIAFSLEKLKEYVDFVTFALKSTDQVRKETALTYAAETLQTYKESNQAVRDALYENILNQEEAAQDEIKISEKKLEKLNALLYGVFDPAQRATAQYNVDQELKRQEDLKRTLAYASAKLDAIDDFNAKEIESNSKAAESQKGLIEMLQAKLKDLKSQQEKATTVVDVKRIGAEITETQKQLDDLLGKTADQIKKAREEYEKLTAALGRGEDVTGLRDLYDNFFKLREDIEKKGKEAGMSASDIAIDIAKAEFDLREKLDKEGLKSRIAVASEAEKVESDKAKRASDFQKNLSKATEERIKADQKVMDEAAKKDMEEFEAREKRKQEIQQAAFQLGTEIAGAFFEISANKRQGELDNLSAQKAEELKLVGDNEQAKAAINEKFDRQTAAIKQKQAIADRNQALFNIAIQTAVAITRTLAEVPKFDFGISTAALVAIYAGLGAVQAAAVASRPIPKFVKGVLNLKGPGNGTSDSILARLSAGESVMTAQETKNYLPLLQAIRNKDIPPMREYRKFPQRESTANFLYELLLAEQQKTNKILKRLPLHNISMDEHGFKKFIIEGDKTTYILNNQFPL